MRVFAGSVALAALLIADGWRGATAAGDVELGKYLSSECVTCHQATGIAAAGVPAIVGMPDDQFSALMNSYKAKERDNAVMQTIAGRLKDEDIAALAAYFGGLKPRAKKN